MCSEQGCSLAVSDSTVLRGDSGPEWIRRTGLKPKEESESEREGDRIGESETRSQNTQQRKTSQTLETWK